MIDIPQHLLDAAVAAGITVPPKPKGPRPEPPTDDGRDDPKPPRPQEIHWAKATLETGGACGQDVTLLGLLPFIGTVASMGSPAARRVFDALNALDRADLSALTVNVTQDDDNCVTGFSITTPDPAYPAQLEAYRKAEAAYRVDLPAWDARNKARQAAWASYNRANARWIEWARFVEKAKAAAVDPKTAALVAIGRALSEEKG